MDTREVQLRELPQGLFSPGGLRIHLRHGPMGQEMEERLPGKADSPLRLAEDAAQILVELGAVDDGFFRRLVEARGGRAAEIQAVQVLWAADGSPPDHE